MALPPLSVLTCRVQGNVARIGLNRPDVRNAINKQVVDELLALLDALASDPSVAVVVLAGEGKLFASGADISELRARRSPDALRAFNARLFQAVEDFPRPTIAAIHGFALGGGLELALACDLRVAARSAKLGLPEVGLGIYPAAGGTWRLPRLIGLGKAKELVFTGRILDGQQAHELGLVRAGVRRRQARGHRARAGQRDRPARADGAPDRQAQLPGRGARWRFPPSPSGSARRCSSTPRRSSAA